MNKYISVFESGLPFKAPRFNEIRQEDYLPAFKYAIDQARSEVDAIVAQSQEPSFSNTIEALEASGELLDRISGLFFNLLEADGDESMQDIAQEVMPLITAHSNYVSLNEGLFKRIKAVYQGKEKEELANDSRKLLEDLYNSFKRNGAELEAQDKEVLSELREAVALDELEFGKRVLQATNAFKLHLLEEEMLEGLPDFVREMGAQTAREQELEGWVFDLSAPSYGAFMKYSSRRDLREQLYRAYNGRCVGENDNTVTVSRIADLRMKIAQLLGYKNYAEYALEDRMAKKTSTVNAFLDKLLDASLKKALEEVDRIKEFSGIEDFMPWDWPYWTEKYRAEKYSFDETELKPYFRLENCVDAIFDLAKRLYGISFNRLENIPVYHEDVIVYEVLDEDGSHLALFYVDFFPRKTKRGGAWMTEFRGQSHMPGKEDKRPFISIVTNFTKPSAGKPSLLTHNEFNTLLHEFGHALHGILSKCRYPSQAGTNVARDFVELPSQIMENWAFEADFLKSFARHYETEEVIPDELIEKLCSSKNYLSAYLQVRQLRFGLLDMAWHTLSESGDIEALEFEKAALETSTVLPEVNGCAISTAFSHIFQGGYAAGYYSYKWAEVLEADAYSRFEQEGIFSKTVAAAFRDNILSKGSTVDESISYRNFRGHDPDPDALLRKLEII